MKLLCTPILAGLCCLNAMAEDWTVNGKDYHNVVVRQIEDDRVHITYDGGIGTIALTDLPPELQKRLNYNPQEAAASAAAAIAEAQQEASHAVPVKVGDTEIKLSDPPGMAEIPKDDPLFNTFKDLTPPDCLLLRSCVSTEALDPTKAGVSSGTILSSATYAVKDEQMDVDYGHFIDFVQHISYKVSQGVLISQQSIVDDADIQKRLDQFQKDTGVTVKEDSDVYSLGMVSRSDGCVAFMTAEYLNLACQGNAKRVKCVSIVAYLLLNKKVVVVETSVTKDLVVYDDVLKLKQAAETYQIALQGLNNL